MIELKTAPPIQRPGWRRHMYPASWTYERGRFELAIDLWNHPAWGLGLGVCVDRYVYELEIMIGPARFSPTWVRNK